jgi:nucleotide-binding universal stress UspA family protein
MGGLLGMVFGSVARETIKNSPVPVMVVPLSGDAEQDK